MQPNEPSMCPGNTTRVGIRTVATLAASQSGSRSSPTVSAIAEEQRCAARRRSDHRRRSPPGEHMLEFGPAGLAAPHVHDTEELPMSCRESAAKNWDTLVSPFQLITRQFHLMGTGSLVHFCEKKRIFFSILWGKKDFFSLYLLCAVCCILWQLVAWYIFVMFA